MFEHEAVVLPRGLSYRLNTARLCRLWLSFDE